MILHSRKQHHLQHRDPIFLSMLYPWHQARVSAQTKPSRKLCLRHTGPVIGQLYTMCVAYGLMLGEVTEFPGSARTSKEASNLQTLRSMPLSLTGPKMVVKTIRLTCSLRRDDELLSPHYTLRRIKQPLARPRSCLQNLVRVVKYIPGAFMSYIVSSLKPISPSSTHTL